MSELSHYEQGYGSFQIGDMTLALPMKSIREVVPFHPLMALPCPQPWIKGGLNLRGVSIPVLDLECLLTRPRHRYAPGCILLVAHENHLLGLIADQVKALFFTNPANIHAVASVDSIGSVFAGSLMNSELNQLVQVLSPQGLFNLPGLPKATDPEQHRQSLELQTSSEDMALNTRTPMMLMQTKSTLFAVNPKDIETTVVNPVLIPSEYAGGFYKGNLNYREQTIPAVDLASYLGVGTNRSDQQHKAQQAFVIRVAGNPIALLIDSVLDIVHVANNAVIPVPSFGLPKSRLLEGVLPCTAFDKADMHCQRGPQYFVLSCQRIGEDHELIELAGVLAKANSMAQQEAKQKCGQNHELDRLMVYCLDTEFSSPIDQVREVLPYRADIEMFERSNPMLGMLTHRNESIPVLDLAQWLGAARQSLGKESSILLVQAHGVCIGFAVTSLTSIENAQWEPDVPVLGEQRQLLHGELKTTQRLAQIGETHNQRLVEVIDLFQQVSLVLAQYRIAPAATEPSETVTEAAQPAVHSEHAMH